MRIVVLDDETYRHEYYRQVHSGDDVVACKTVGECREALKKPCDLLLLDYDLERGNSAGIIAEVARLKHRPGRIVVHSRSERGGPFLVRALRNIGIQADSERFSYRKAKELLGYFPAKRAG